MQKKIHRRDAEFSVFLCGSSHFFKFTSIFAGSSLIAPDFALPGTDGRNWTYAQAAGPQGLVVMFICNHCPFVKHVNAELVRLSNDYIPKGVKFDATDLMELLIKNNCKVISFPIHAYWLDIGSMDDYSKAQNDIIVEMLYVEESLSDSVQNSSM